MLKSKDLNDKTFYRSDTETTVQRSQLTWLKIPSELVIAMVVNSRWLGALSTTPWCQFYIEAINSCLHFLGQNMKEGGGGKDKFIHHILFKLYYCHCLRGLCN